MTYKRKLAGGIFAHTVWTRQAVGIAPDVTGYE